MTERKLWGYRSNGGAKVFLLQDGESLPAGWSDDIAVITDPAKRTVEAVMAAAGDSVTKPVRLSPPDDGEVYFNQPQPARNGKAA
jgi:hypothetical protein